MTAGPEPAVAKATLESQQGIGRHDLAEQISQLALLRPRERIKAAWRCPHEVIRPLLDRRAFRGQRDGLDPPVGRMGPSLGEAGPLEIVDEGGDVGPVEAEVGGQLPHRRGSVGGEVDEGLEDAGRHARRRARHLHPVARFPLEDEAIDHRPALPSQLGAHISSLRLERSLLNLCVDSTNLLDFTEPL